jgi:hypothetical protein
MLIVDTFKDRQGKIIVQYNPENADKIQNLRAGLHQYSLKNPLVTFSEHCDGVRFKDYDEETTGEMAWIVDTLGQLWKNNPEENVFTILSRMTDAYLCEHEELLDLREEKQKRTNNRKRSTKRSHNKNKSNNIPNVFIADEKYAINELELDPSMVPLDEYEYGVGLQAVTYSTFLREKKDIENDFSVLCNRFYDNGTDTGIVTYRSAEAYRQEVTIYFDDAPGKFNYSIRIEVITYGNEGLDIEKALNAMSEDSKCMPLFSLDSVIEPVIEPVYGPCQIINAMRLSYSMDITIEDVMSDVRMTNIFVTTEAIRNHIRKIIHQITGK